jgi:hypothetical protein
MDVWITLGMGYHSLRNALTVLALWPDVLQK